MTDADTSLLSAELRTRYVQEGWVPLGRDGDAVVIGASRDLGRAARSEISAAIGAPLVVRPLDQRAIVDQVVQHFRDDFADQAANGLYHADPGLSARRVLSRAQQVGLAIFLVVLVASLILWTLPTVVIGIAVASIVFLSSTLFKFSVALHGSRYDLVQHVDADAIAALRDEDLPIYTVLVPVFREARIVGRLVENLGRLDYPAHKLEVIILVEEEDDETRDAIAVSSPPENFIVVTVPKGAPQTKPRACNVGLEVARGSSSSSTTPKTRPSPTS